MGKNNNTYRLQLWGVLFLAWGTTALGGCGTKAATCKKACSLIASCSGVDLSGDAGAKDWICPLSDECSKSALEYCFAKCINESSCEAILGEEAEAASKLQECQLACEVTATPLDGAMSKDAGTKKDRGSTDLPPNCQPSCAGKECGDDGCHGICGICQSPNRCSSEGQCDCQPSCAGKECGDDGCGGLCGTCYSPDKCSSSGQCGCTPNCMGKECGDDGCGGLCGTCYSPEKCNAYGQCGCTPSCSGKQCGSDGCGGSCGTCSSSSTYSCSAAGQCVPLSSVNSGKLCSSNSSCNTSTETCLIFNSTDTVGMCLGLCQTTGNTCVVPNSSTNFSVCAFTTSQGQNICAWICEVQGEYFDCPNPYDYSCEIFDVTQPDVKVCTPLQ